MANLSIFKCTLKLAKYLPIKHLIKLLHPPKILKLHKHNFTSLPRTYIFATFTASFNFSISFWVVIFINRSKAASTSLMSDEFIKYFGKITLAFHFFVIILVGFLWWLQRSGTDFCLFWHLCALSVILWLFLHSQTPNQYGVFEFIKESAKV